MNEILGEVGDLAVRDKVTSRENHERLLAELWTRFGGNVADRKRLEKNILLAVGLEAAWAEATWVVDTTLIELKGIQEQLKHIKEQLIPEVRDRDALLGGGASPLFARQNIGALQLEGHIERIETCVKRLQDKRTETQKWKMERKGQIQAEGDGLFLTAGTRMMGYKYPKSRVQDAQIIR